MDIAAARTFLEVARTGSFVGAAQTLNLTQAAVSARIRVLEEQLGYPVFERTKSGVRPTRAGEQFTRFATALVQTWENARRAVALPEGAETAITVGSELSLWNPLLGRWLEWMRREYPGIALRLRIAPPEALMQQVQAGAIDLAVLYAAPQRPGVVTELLVEERLVHVTTAGPDQPAADLPYVEVDWGREFDASFRAAFPEQGEAQVAMNYGPLALEYLLAAGGSAYFRMGYIGPWLESGRLRLVPESPQFPYPAYLVHSARIDPEVMACLREGLRAALDLPPA
ncbi:LysR family transcriptional regulator [Novosphingobium sp. 1949]|uniref:LysR family transcriptional regulator n=1 Tax=Novosphingobium organovorum TaxID=2930092 RepID=A0ABT0BDZ8_9SPHN|nr:LysR family transcriptional regulator [Novosphingobium organovorum]MCJ2183266.1 LysR family transcriptional regulator [Novosphingobium organovorum]